MERGIRRSDREQRFERTAVAGTLQMLVGRFPVPASNNNRGKETEMETYHAETVEEIIAEANAELLGSR